MVAVNQAMLEPHRVVCEDASNVKGGTGGCATVGITSPAGDRLITGETFIAASPPGRRSKRESRQSGKEFSSSMRAQAAGRSILDGEPDDSGVSREIFSGRVELPGEFDAIDNDSPAGVHFYSFSGGNSIEFPATVMFMALSFGGREREGRDEVSFSV
jgi:hypothetical protein